VDGTGGGADKQRIAEWMETRLAAPHLHLSWYRNNKANRFVRTGEILNSWDASGRNEYILDGALLGTIESVVAHNNTAWIR
jgi:hypothetical protein